MTGDRGANADPSANPSEGVRSSVRVARLFAVRSALLNSSEDFVEEFAGNAGSGRVGSMFGDGDAEADTSLEGCLVRHGGVKYLAAEMFGQLLAIASLQGAGSLESRYEVAEQSQFRVITSANIFEGFGHLRHALCTPVGGFERNDQAIRRRQRRHADKRNAGRTIDEHQVVLRSERPTGFTKGQVQVVLFPGQLL